MATKPPLSFFEFIDTFTNTRRVLEALGCSHIQMPMRDQELAYTDRNGHRHTYAFTDYKTSCAVAVRTELRLQSDL